MIVSAHDTSPDMRFSRPPEMVARVFTRRYHLHAPGIVYTGITILLVLGAINGQNNLLFWAFGLAVAGMVISGLLSGAALMGIRIRRDVIGPGEVGEPMRVRYTLTNRNFLIPCFSLTIEELPEAAASRHIGSWPVHCSRPVAFLPHVGPRRTEACDAFVRPWARGVATFDAIRVSTTFPFGLTLKSVVFVQHSNVLIHPWRVPLLGDSIKKVRSLAGDGDSNRSDPGDAGEFFSLREYQPHQSIRLIAWRPSARLGRAVVKQLARTSAGRLWIGIDVVDAESTDAERAVSLAASLAVAASKEGIDVGLYSARDGLHEPPRHGDAHLRRILDALAMVGLVRSRGAILPPLAAPRRDSMLTIAANPTAARGRPFDSDRAVIAPDTPGFAVSEAWSLMPRPTDSTGQSRKRFSTMLIEWARGMLP